MAAFRFVIWLGIIRGLPLHDCQQICTPFNGNIFWDVSSDNDTFDIQRNFILRIMHNAPDGSTIRVYTIDNTLKTIINGIKNKTKLDNEWTETLARVPLGNTEHHIISYKTLEDAISEYPKEAEIKAEELFFVVNDKSKIDDEEKAIEKLKKRKTFIVFYGTSQPSKFWKNLATDKHHIIQLNDNIDADVDSFLALSCKDSRLNCYTDMYWTGDECKSCTHICSRTPAEDPQYCREACPYFRDREMTSEKNGYHSLVPNQEWIVVFLFYMLRL
ncbi:uncharacterized protein LOC128557772 isoform X3 [Mercenaria mercenaria]|uniref:uncharacterized protein LOC128557772 isoform X3 n=1 Tax=Mercenaria mercenaria TaxID=6596 RepID=UPI00234E9359|nr:uncharacterized protein LOC128557772 isoform X3 [Mercenaria mercenaria]XP_053401990.1 uncharacterized protein LOC128557772 isoform X3 [Mercenaria mercenaria]XP_053401991.1 uncharacterized protein LOC128557772 isoform X3 [Mercenaria mercenaria]